MTAMPMALAAAADLVMLWAHAQVAHDLRRLREEPLSRVLRVAAAQSGPIQKADSRQAVVRRMIDLLDQAKAQTCDLVVYTELALTTFFPRWYMTDQAEIDAWFEREMPNPATRPLFERAAEHKIAISFGYAELTPDGQRFNTSILIDRDGRIVGKYRKVHLPGHADYDPAALVPASREALFRARRPRLPGLAHDGRHFGHVHLQRPALARDLSGDGAAGRGDDRARLQHAVGELAEAERRPGSSACSSTSSRCRPAPIRTPPGWWRRRSAASRTAIRCSAAA